MPLVPGARIGSYEVLSLIGQGGMGEVYRARDTALGRDVAIKRLPDAVSSDPERLARFEREARTLAALNHPNVAQIYAVEAGTIVMELVPGETLRGPLPLDRVLDFAGQIAAALEAAHDKGIIHRDLKPGNVMVTPDGVIKVLDFSLAGREATDAGGDPAQSPTLTGRATALGMILGTAAYMAPEQASGKPVDKRADIFAFGVVCWEMVTGRRMFEGDTISHVLAAVLTKEPDLTAVPAPIRPMLARCLEKDPKKRLRDIGDALSLVASLEPTPAKDGGAAGRSAARRFVGTAGWVATGAVVAIAATVAWRTPAPANSGGDPPIVRFQITRSADIYNQTTSAFAVSPDGLTLAHYDEVGDGRLGLFLRTLATGQQREVQGARTFSPRRDSLIWSPDGRHLVRATQGGAAVVDVATDATRPLCDCRFGGGSWNRDGVVLLGSGGTGTGITRVSATDRTPVTITRVDQSRGEQDGWPVFLPDGRRFLFTRTSPDEGPVTYVGRLDGGTPIRIVEGSYRMVWPASSGRDSYLIGVDTAGVVAQAFDLETLAVTGPATILVAGAIAVSGSQNGVLATSAAGSRPRTIPTWFDRKGVPRGVVSGAGMIDSVALSADGRKLVVSEPSADTGIQNDIWLMDLSSGSRTRLTFNPANDSTPVWSSDGTRIAYTSRRGNASVPYQRTADGTGSETPLFAYDRDAYVNDWSNDGRWVLYSSLKEGRAFDNDLWVLPMTDGIAGKPELYVGGPGKQQQAQFSPDGRFVAYGSDESGTFEIYVQPFPDASQGKWIVSSGGGVEPRWSRDGKELFFFAGQTLMAAPVSVRPTFSSGTPVALFEAAIQAGYTNDSHRWQVAPDGQRFLLLPLDRQQQAPPLDVLVNWPTLLNR